MLITRIARPILPIVAALLVICSKASAEEPSPLLPVPVDRVDHFEALLGREPVGVGRPIGDREAWARVAGYAEIAKLKSEAEARRGEPVGDLSDDLFLEVNRTGSRIGYERASRRRTELLSLFTIAECVDNRGDYLPAIESYLDAILGERTWVAPPHDLKLINFNHTAMEVDLSAAARAWTLATVDYWLGDRLAPETRARIRAEVRRRVLDPYLAVTTSGRIPPGTGGWWWLTGTNNWNAVCNAGVVGAGLALLPDRRERATLVAAAEQCSLYFLSGYTDAGYCSEGLGYWEYGFGSYVLMAETLAEASAGGIDFLASPKVRAVATYPERLEIMPGVYPAYADSGPGGLPAVWMLDYLNRRLGLGHPEWTQPEPTGMPFRHGMGARLFGVGLLAFIPHDDFGAPPVRRAWRVRDVFPDAQVFALRPATRDSDLLAVSLKGGTNGEHHNHNDLGSYVVALAGETPLLDPGMESYTRRTFSPQRYESRLLNSYGHPVPVVAGRLQSAGGQFAAKVLATDFTPERDRVTLDLRGGYEVPELTGLERTFSYAREGRGVLTVRDDFTYDSPQSFETAFLTQARWRRTGPSEWVVGEGKSAVRVTVSAGGASLVVRDEIIDETNPSKRKPTRIGIALAEPARTGFIEVTVTPAP